MSNLLFIASNVSTLLRIWICEGRHWGYKCGTNVRSELCMLPLRPSSVWSAFRVIQVTQSGLMSRRGLSGAWRVPTQRLFLLSADKAQGTVDLWYGQRSPIKVSQRTYNYPTLYLSFAKALQVFPVCGYSMGVCGMSTNSWLHIKTIGCLVDLSNPAGIRRRL